MDLVMQVREQIYAQFHRSSAGSAHFFLDKNADDYAAYYTAMYLIQDTAESVWQHMKGDFSANPLSAYLEFWGVMQAAIIQQDSIAELHRVVVGGKLNTQLMPAWSKLRDTRNLCAGHPINRNHGVPAPQRTFIGRSHIKYDGVRYELWDASTEKLQHPSFDLRTLIRDYDGEASQALQNVFDHMKVKWP